MKRSVLGVADGPVVTIEAAAAMAEGARRVLGGDVGLATTGVAGPSEQEGRPVGTAVVGLALPGSAPEAVELRLPGDRERVRQLATISALNALRRRLSQLDEHVLKTGVGADRPPVFGGHIAAGWSTNEHMFGTTVM